MRNLVEIRENLKKILSSKVSLCLGISLTITFITLNLNLFRVEAFFYDLRMRWKGDENPHPEIRLLVLDGEGGTTPNEQISLSTHLRALEILLLNKPQAIAYLNKFDALDVASDPAHADKFVLMAQEAQQSGTKIFFGTDVDLGGEILPPYPLSLLPHSPSVIHKDGTIFGEDKVTRRALLTVFEEPSLHLRLAYPNLDQTALVEKAQTLRGAYYFKPADSWHVMIRYPGSTSMKDNTYPRINLSDLLAGKYQEDLRGKIILIDAIRRDSVNDFAFTPYSRITYTHPKLMVHAAILDTLLKDQAIKIGASKIDMALTFILSFVLAFITVSMSPSRGIFALILMSLSLFSFSLFLFKVGYWLRLVHPLCSMFFTYYLIVPYRAILEYKKRWEVQEKHDLLVQVEEMKGNFLSLMSHDLKTPVARIQGLAEMILRQGRLHDQQEIGVREILSSTESLDKFISKILSLTKVESNEIKINKKSKDINKILEQATAKLEFQAVAKKIQIELSLEPLFPIPLDSALIIQVFTNIIDNAIKYSPEGSRVEIKSREIDRFVEIIITDNGPGLDTEEREQLFTKFFRGKSHPGDPSKGSGLGLYLSKFFIELHKGSIKVETEKGAGSRFQVLLPLSD